MTRARLAEEHARLAEEAEVAAFRAYVNNLADGVATSDKILGCLLELLKVPGCLRATSILYGVINRALEKSILPDWKLPHLGRSIPVDRVLNALLERGKDMLAGLEVMLTKPPTRSSPRWMLHLTKGWLLEYFELFDHLVARSTLSSPIVAQHQKRIMLERVEAFHKSPYFLELGARLYDPVKFDNGWFEDHAMFDEDGFLE